MEVKQLYNQDPSVERGTASAGFNHELVDAALLPLGLRRKRIRGDGNCQFRAVADIVYAANDGQECHRIVRNIACNELLRNSQVYSGFVDDSQPWTAELSDAHKVIFEGGRVFEAYCAHMARDGVWGDNITLQALCNALGLHVDLVKIRPDGSLDNAAPTHIHPTDSDRLVVHRFTLVYFDGVHYDSTIPVAQGGVGGNPASLAHAAADGQPPWPAASLPTMEGMQNPDLVAQFQAFSIASMEHQRTMLAMQAKQQAAMKAVSECIDPQTVHSTVSLIQAAFMGNIEAMKQLVDAGASVNAVHPQGYRALHMAAQAGKLDCISFLVEQGADIHATNLQGHTALHAAAGNGSLGSVRLLLELGANTEATDFEGDTPLHLAAINGKLEVLDYLLSQGASPHATDALLKTPLLGAVHFDTVGNWMCAQRLLDAGADIDASGLDKVSALMRIAIDNQPTRIEALVARGANVNHKDIQGLTPLLAAAPNGNPEVVAALLSAGASTTEVDLQGNSALHRAVLAGHEAVAAVLLVGGADIHACNPATVGSSGSTALHLAERDGKTSVARLLSGVAAQPELLAELRPAASPGGRRSTADLLSAANKLRLKFEIDHMQQLSLGAAKGAGQAVAAQQNAPLVDTSPWQLDSFELEPVPHVNALLGKGSFGTVRVCLWKRIPVAVKELHEYDESQLAELKKEVELLAVLRHPNILGFIGYCPSHKPCIVTEYCEYGSLLGLLLDAKANRFPAQQLTLLRRLCMARDVSRGMLYLHEHKPQIIHRDLKAVNLLVDSNLTVKVGDFGLSKAVVPGPALSSVGGPGNPRWLAPELLRDRKANATTKSDVYSFGIVLWELLAWNVPWDGELDDKVKEVVLAGGRPQVPHVLPGLPLQEYELPILEKYVDLMEHCWQDDPEGRHSFKDLETCLSDMIERLNASVALARQAAAWLPPPQAGPPHMQSGPPPLLSAPLTLQAEAPQRQVGPVPLDAGPPATEAVPMSLPAATPSSAGGTAPAAKRPRAVS